MFPRLRLARLAAAAASGILTVLAQEPVGLGPVAWIALVPLWWAVLGERRVRWAFVYGLVAGAVGFGFQLSWIFLFGWMAWTGLTLIMALYHAVATAAASLTRRLPLAPLLAAGSWVGMELVRDRWPFGGFPWGTLGTSQATVPGVRWLAGTVGAYGLTFLVAFAAAVLADRILHGRVPWGSIALVGGVLALFIAVDVLRYAPSDPGEPLDVALVQGNVPRPARPDQRVRILADHVELTRRLTPGEAGLVVWAEDAIGVGAPEEALRELDELAQEVDAPMLVGRSVADVSDRTFVNAVEHIVPGEGVVATYAKRHPVPFGEYVPLGFLRRYVSTLDQVPYDLERGDRVTLFEVGGELIATPICFESVFPRDVRAFAREGAELYVFSTNNASFERTGASLQHLAHARMRSLETRQWSVQAALSGISAVIGPDGSVSHRTQLFEQALVRAEVRTRPGASLFVRWGDLFSWGWTVGTVLALVLYVGLQRTGRRGRGAGGAIRRETEPHLR